MKILDELEKLRAEATQGEWIDCDKAPKWDTPLVCGYDWRAAHSTPPYFSTGPRVDGVGQASADMRLIVAAVNALPALIEVARAAIAEQCGPACKEDCHGKCGYPYPHEDEFLHCMCGMCRSLSRLASRAGEP